MNQNYLTLSDTDYNTKEKEVDDKIRTLLYEIYEILTEFTLKNFAWLKNGELVSIECMAKIAARQNGS